MTIQRRPRPQLRRQLAALAAVGGVLYLVAATAASPSARSALDEVGRQGELALGLLRAQLGDPDREEILPAAVSLAIGQSPVLVSGQEAVLRLRGTEEPDDSRDGDTPQPPSDVPPQPEAPLPEEPAQPDPPLVFADNGVEARTLVPSSPEGYIVSGGVYINTRTEYPLDASLLDGTFAAALPEEEGPQILIVHTHGSEAYTMPPGQEYEPSGESRTTDTSLNVVRVGDELAKTLEEAGLTVLHDPTLHDYPEYSGAYGRSLDAVNAYLAEYPTISFVLDVHRDAIAGTDGSMYKVVSSAEGVNTDWRENLKLAAAIQQRLTADYPTLMRPITVRNSRYNQHTTPGSLLVEMGAAGNSLDEALLSARLLGKALAETILEKGA